MGLKPDSTFGQFRLIRELGKGATGTVFLAEQTTLGRECALKILAPQLVSDETFLERFRREGRIAASLRHAGIVRIFDLVECDSGYALAMDYIEGQELQELLSTEKKLPQTVALDVIGKVLDALDYAHGKGVVHRDIKPANILLEPDGSVFLTDFSIARMAGGEKLTQTGTVIGTPEYMAPEQFDGKEVDARADVYATALILYEMLAGINPFRGETLAEVVKKQVLVEPPPLTEQAEVPSELADLVHKGLQKSPDARFQTAGEMLQALRNLGTAVEQSSGSLTRFLSSVELGAISMDDAVAARQNLKEAIDKSFKRRLTIVMLDLAGSSKIKIPNQTLIADRAFQDYRQTINRILEKHGCERYDWSGDGAISLFSDPIAGVDAAVEVQRAVGHVGARHSELPDALKVRIGIRTGLVYYDPRRTLGEFASRTVDQAGHLEKDCPPGSIRLGDTTVEALNGKYPVRSKGRNRDDIEVFELGPEVPAPGPTAPLEKGSETRDMPPSSEPSPASISPRSEPVSPAPFTPLSAKPATNPNPGPPPPFIPTGDYDPTRSKSFAQTEPTNLFNPKNETLTRGGSSVEDSYWWGWKSLGFLVFILTGILTVNRFIPGATIPHQGTRLFVSLFLLHLAFIPLYCIYQLFRDQEAKAKEAAVAGGVLGLAMLAIWVFFIAGSH